MNREQEVDARVVVGLRNPRMAESYVVALMLLGLCLCGQSL